MEQYLGATARDASVGSFEPEGDGSSAGPATAALLATPLLAGLAWLPVYLYANAVKESQHLFMSDGWGMAPLGTIFVGICGLILALQLVLLVRALPDTTAGRRAELIVVFAFAMTVSVMVFGYLGLFTLGDLPDGFPSSAACTVGLLVGAIVTVVVPTAVVARWSRHEVPVGSPLKARAWTRLALVTCAAVLLITLPLVANATATPGVMIGLALVPVLDLASWFFARDEGDRST